MNSLAEIPCPKCGETTCLALGEVDENFVEMPEKEVYFCQCCKHTWPTEEALANKEKS